MRNELRELRRTNGAKPVSKMRKADISAELQQLRTIRDETPAVASTSSSKSRGREPIIENIKKAKEQEFPTRPSKSMSAEMRVRPGRPPRDDIVAAPKKKASAPIKKMKMVQVEITDSEQEY